MVVRYSRGHRFERLYTVTLTRGSGDGSGGAEAYGGAEYIGESYADRVGTFDGDVHIRDYARLCQLLDVLGFRDMNESCSWRWTRSPIASRGRRTDRHAPRRPARRRTVTAVVRMGHVSYRVPGCAKGDRFGA